MMVHIIIESVYQYTTSSVQVKRIISKKGVDSVAAVFPKVDLKLCSYILVNL